MLWAKNTEFLVKSVQMLSLAMDGTESRGSVADGQTRTFLRGRDAEGRWPRALAYMTLPLDVRMGWWILE